MSKEGKIGKIRIDPLSEKDKKFASILEVMVNKEYPKYEGIMRAIIGARGFVELSGGWKTPNSIWDNIFQEVIKFEQEFMAHLVITDKAGNSRTMGEMILPQYKNQLESGKQKDFKLLDEPEEEK